MSRIRQIIRRILRDTSGSASVEFVLMVPVVLMFGAFSIELGAVTLRSTMLERGLDIAVREVRLGNGAVLAHDDLKKMICERTLFIPNCQSKLRLEMRPTSIRDFTPLDPVPDCVDAGDPGKPLRDFEFGGQNRLTLMRACVKYTPIFPRFALGNALTSDANGDATMVATTSFVQEPTT